MNPDVVCEQHITNVKAPALVVAAPTGAAAYFSIQPLMVKTQLLHLRAQKTREVLRKRERPSSKQLSFLATIGINHMASKKRPRNTGNKFWTPARVAIAVTVLTLIAAIGILSRNSGDETAKRNESVPLAPNPSVRKLPEAPAELTNLPPNLRDAELRSLNGRSLKLADYAGKVMLVNLWATWCAPCRIEIPELVKLHKEFKSQGLEMVGLSMENADASAETVRNFVRDFRMDYRVGWATPEVAGTLMQGRDAIPQSFVISRDGRILKRFVGFSPTDTPAQIRQVIEEALSNKG